MRKGKILSLIGAGLIVATSPLLMVACGGGSQTLAGAKIQLEALLGGVKESSKQVAYKVPSTSTSSVNVNLYISNTPLAKLITDTDDYLDGVTLKEELGLLYDIPFGYSINVVEETLYYMNQAQIQDSKLSKSQKNAVSELYDAIDDFNNEKKDYLNYVEYFSQYAGSVGEGLAVWNNALYNYKKDYQNYVRAAINLATAANNALNTIYTDFDYREMIEVPAEEGEEETEKTDGRRDLATAINLKILDSYYSLLVESLDAKYLTSYEKSIDGAQFFESTMTNYIDFIRDVLKREFVSGGTGRTSDRYYEKLNEEAFSNLQTSFLVYSETDGNVLGVLDNFDMHSYRFSANFDMFKLSKKSETELYQIENFYKNTLKGFTDHYFALFN